MVFPSQVGKAVPVSAWIVQRAPGAVKGSPSVRRFAQLSGENG
ncbi:hypothetical protein [Acrocarpospora corrugata]|nr:hypothetical protein [Acrocarpospora corrugata]